MTNDWSHGSLVAGGYAASGARVPEANTWLAHRSALDGYRVELYGAAPVPAGARRAL